MAGRNRQAQHDRQAQGRGKRNNSTQGGNRRPETEAKFQEFNKDKVNQTPLRAMNDEQQKYIDYCRSKPYVLAIGWAGSSKTYIPTRIAIEKLLLQQIDKIYLVRPAISSSKGLGFYAGDKIEKSKNWLAPVLDVLNEYLGESFVDYLIKKNVIEPVPLETIKGRSMKNCFIIVDESEDLTREEFIKCVTRLGNNSTMVFAGDIMQTDLKQQSGLSLGVEMCYEFPDLNWGLVNFDRPSDIVRGEDVKQAILAFRRKGLM